MTRHPNIPTLRVVAALMAALALLAGCARGPADGGAQGDDVPTTGYVKGAVMLSDAQAGGHAGVLVFVAGTGHSARTDENGAYLISGVPAGEYGFVAERQGYTTLAVDRQRVDPARHTRAAPLELATGILERADSQLTTAGRAMRPLGSLRGIVTALGAASGENVHVRVDGTDVLTVSDEAGEYRLRNVEAGEVRLLFTKPGYQPERAVVTVEADKEAGVRDVVMQPVAPAPEAPAAPLAVAPTPSAPIVRADLAGDRSIVGTVELRDAEGNTITDYDRVTVSLDGSDYVVTPDESGRFTFNRLPPGVYTVLAMLDRLEPVRQVADLTTQRSVTMTLKLSEGTPIDEATGTVTGRVVLEPPAQDAAADAAGVTVGVAGTQLVALTAADGTFRITNVPVGAVTLVAGKEGYEEGRADGVELAAGATVDVGEVALELRRDSPRVVSTSPGSGARDVMVDRELTVVIRFNKKMNAQTVRAAVAFEPSTPAAVHFGQGAHPRAGDDTLVLVFDNGDERNPIRYNTNYRVTVARGASDLDGNPMKDDFVLSFATGGVGITGTEPRDGQADATVNELAAPVVIRFNTRLKADTVNDRNIRIRPRPEAVPRFTLEADPTTGWHTVEMYAQLRPRSRYTVTVTRNVRAANNQPLSGVPRSFTFTTGGGLTEAVLPSRIIR